MRLPEKTTEENRKKLLKKISVLFQQIDDNIAGESLFPENEADIPPEIQSVLSDRLNQFSESADKESEAVLRKEKKQIKELAKQKDKLEEYSRTLETLGYRNSYSKTDKDAYLYAHERGFDEKQVNQIRI